MQKWIFNLEVITPLFLSGASPNETEFRPPSIKNLMRFWYRTCFDTSSLSTSREKEIYGSTENQGIFKPTIKNVQNLLIKKFSKGDFGQNFTKWENNEPLNGINYLGFSLDFGENHRSSIHPTTTFDLCIKYFGNSDEENKSILASLWLLIWLGNIGTRSRRGFGSLKPTKEPSEDTHGLVFYFEGDTSGFGDFFKTNLEIALSWVNPQFSRQKYLSKHTALISDQSQIYFWKGISPNWDNATFPRWEDAMNYAGIMLQRYRKRSSPDYLGIKDFIHRGIVPNNIEKAAFGLPMPVQYKSLFRRYFLNYLKEQLDALEIKKTDRELESISRRKRVAIEMLASWNINARVVERLWKKAEQYSKADIDGVLIEEIDDEKARLRRSSPLFIKIVKTNEAQFSLIFSFLPSEFLAENAKVKIVAKDRKPELIETTDYSTVKDFLADNVFPNATLIAF